MTQVTSLKRRNLIKGLAGVGLLSQLPLSLSSALAAQSGRVARSPLYIDGLSFLPEDLRDLKASSLNAYLCDISAIEEVVQSDGSVNYKRTYKACIKSITQALNLVNQNPDKLMLGAKGSDIELAKAKDKTAVFFQIQGADCVEKSIHSDFDQLDEFYDKGLRVLQLTHHYGNAFAGGALDSAVRANKSTGIDNPLTAAGHKLIERLNQKKMLIDVSHSSVQTALDTAKASQSPIVQSHGAVRAIVNHARCSPDNVIRAIADTGGVFGAFMMTFWLTNEARPTTEHYLAHLKHVAKVGGIDAVAIANDYPLRGHKALLALNNDNQEGVKQYLEWWHSLRAKGVLGFDIEPSHVVVPELNHIHRMERIDTALSKVGFSSHEREKIMGENWQRVLNQVLL